MAVDAFDYRRMQKGVFTRNEQSNISFSRYFKKGTEAALPLSGVGTVYSLSITGRSALEHLCSRRRLPQFLPFDFAKPGGQCFLGARKIRPTLEAAPLCAGSLVRVE